MDLPKTSRAAVVTAYNAPLEIRELPIPDKLETGAILVKTVAASMCGSDLHVWEGIMGQLVGFELPVVLGHEMVGTIVRLGPGVSRDSIGQPLKEGDNIVWEHGSCGSCYNCTILAYNSLCKNRDFYMVTCCEKFPYLVGGFSQYIYVYPTSRRLKVPDDIPAAWASAASCALRTVMHGFERLGNVESHQTALIQGSGPLGLFMTAVLDNAGVGNIIVIGAPKQRLDLARAWGAQRVISIEELPRHSDRLEVVRDITGGRGADIVVEVSGAPGAFAEGVDFAAPGARYIVIGQVGGPPTTFQAEKVVQKNFNIRGVMSAEIRHYYAGLQFMRRTRQKYNFGDMLTNQYSLSEINDALASYKAGKEIKPLIIP